MLAASLAACGGGSTLPVALALEVSDATAHEGDDVTLTPHFAGGAGRIEPGVGEVRDGQPVTVTVTQDTVFTLTVSGNGATDQLSTPVAIVFDGFLSFEDGDPLNAAWDLQAIGGPESFAKILGGQLELVWQSAGITCGETSAQLLPVPADTKFSHGAYEHVVFDFAGFMSFTRDGLGVVLGNVTLSIDYRGEHVDFAVPLQAFAYEPHHLLVDWGDKVKLMRDDTVLDTQTPSAGGSTADTTIWLHAEVCQGSLIEHEGLVIDDVSIAGR